jgi:hypothetical protein
MRPLIPLSWLALPSACGRDPGPVGDGGRARRWGRAFFVSVALVLAGNPVARGETIRQPTPPQESAPAHAAQPSAPSAADVSLQDVEQRLGPFRIGGQDFAVVLHLKRPTRAQADRSEEAALSALEIQDASGASLYREIFSYALEAGTFSDSCAASAQLLNGGAATGLLISIGCLPSAPRSGNVWELFGLMNGKLIRFGRPFTTDGDFLGLIPIPPRKIGRATLFLPDVMQFRVWAGNFQVTVPLHVDWMQGRLMPGQRCFEQTGHGLRESGCEVPVEAERVPSDQELTFVRLFTEASEGMGIPRHVVLRKDSQVEILGAKIKTSWDQSRDVILFGVDDQDPWLKVRIDGQEGWIHTQEDFNAIGLPQTG